MPGIVGYASPVHEPYLRNNVSSMLAELICRFEPESGIVEAERDRVAFGISTRGDLPLQKASMSLSSENASLVIDGEFYAYRDRDLDTEGQIEVAQSILRATSINELKEILSDIEGTFSFALYLRDSNLLVFGVDAFGLKPLYYLSNPKAVLFASEIKAILPPLSNSPKANWVTASDIFAFGYPLGNKTLFEGIERTPPGSINVVNISDNSMKLHKYWQLEKMFQPNGTYDRSIAKSDLVESFERAVKRRLSDSEKICMGISGGLDSRAIAAVVGEKSPDLISYTIGAKGQPEQIAGAKIAALAGIKNYQIDIDQKDLCDPRTMTELEVLSSDGLKPPGSWLTSLYENFSRVTDASILIVGLGAEATKVEIVSPVRLTREFEALRTQDEICDYFFRNLNRFHLSPQRIKEVFSKEFADHLSMGPKNSVRATIQQMPPDMHPTDMMCYWFLEAYLSRHAVAALSTRRPNFEIRFPFSDRTFLNALVNSPPAWRTDATVQIETIRSRMPAMMNVENVNTGIRLSAGFVESSIRKVQQKIASRLRFSSAPTPGFSDILQRGILSDFIRNTLLSEACFSRGIYNPDGITQLINDYMNGDDSLTSTVASMLSLEIWYENFVDKYRK